ncbi:MAG: GntR family transcriptional regulator, transcriptional repressor for pyruvate dehydrogenase complex [Frankiales bacterium]|jgi:GntR family transcriptional repressor for pyruvate dehydrogenase complex|nr:GntR family transcriptional regulator, transcriptional repressor for pyruvate dehydrogenase complex [Frankiales bacterium]
MSRERTHEVVLRRIEEDLAAGRITLGQRLPGERQLAEQLGVSRPSVREAIRVLEAMGIVRTAAGSGAAAGAVIVADPSTALASAMRLHLATSHLVIDDIVATRLLIESWSVRTAATAKVHGPFAEAERLLDAMDDAGLTPELFHQLDAEFHVELARLAGNPLVTAVMSALRDSIQEYVMAAVPGLPDWSATARKLRREHRSILGAVRSGNGERAAALVTSHITGFYRAAGIGRRPH